MSETAQAFGWTITTMQADSALTTAATGGVWQGYADIGITAPYAMVTQQVATDVLTMAGIRLFVHILLQIKAIGPTSQYAAIVTIANRIDALFKSVRHITLSSGGVLACYREQELAYDELVNGQQWSHLGGLYHLELQGV